MQDLGPGSEAVANYKAICNSIADSYPQSVSHGLQKDAIQNSLDARKSKRSTVRVEFEVIKNQKGEFFTFTDSNTTGLTGDVVASVDDYKSLHSDDHWARFEAFAFTKDDPDALGARGQGKFIFLRASKKYTMFYDTLRSDGIYRLGATKLSETGRSNHPKRGERWEDEFAKEMLEKYCGFNPLTEVGTRIIVVAPSKEVLDSIRNGEFADAIQETWFRAIEKKQLEVCINTEGKQTLIGLPANYPLPKTDSKKFKTWVYGKDFTDAVVSGSEFKIKNFHAAYLPDVEIPKAQQGIAILQNSMKITTLLMEMAPTEFKEKITGFVEFDKLLDQELRKGNNQHPNHYQLRWRSRIPRDIKAFVQGQLQEFGRKKLGIGEDPRERKKRTRDSAEQEAMKMLIQHASDLELALSRGRSSHSDPKPDPDPPPPPKHKKIGVSMAVQFPDGKKKPRVDWGEEMLVAADCFNKTEADVTGKFAIQVLQGDTVVEKLTDLNIVLPSRSTGLRKVKINNDGPFTINLNQSRYRSAGEYRIHATLVDISSGDKIDSATKRFWLAEDPPRRFPFNLKQASLETEHAWQPAGDINNDPTIYYNTNHPQYISCEDDGQNQADYLLNICLEGALHFILTRPFDEGEDPDYRPLDTNTITSAYSDEVPEKVYSEISRYLAKVRWRIYEA